MPSKNEYVTSSENDWEFGYSLYFMYFYQNFQVYMIFRTDYSDTYIIKAEVWGREIL